jgi:hypothetical protein
MILPSSLLSWLVAFLTWARGARSPRGAATGDAASGKLADDACTDGGPLRGASTGRFSQFDVGTYHTCTLRGDGTLVCRGVEGR